MKRKETNNVTSNKEGGGESPSQPSGLDPVVLIDLADAFGPDALDVITWVLAKKEVVLGELTRYRR